MSVSKTRYTVKVDQHKVEIEAYGTAGAVSHAMRHLQVSHASRVVVIAGNGERATYLGVQMGEYGCFAYQRRG